MPETTSLLEKASKLGTEASKTTGVAFKPFSGEVTGATLTPQAPFKPQPVKPATQSDGMLAYLSAQGEQAATAYEQQAQERLKSTEGVGSELMSLLQEPGQTALTANAYEQGGVNTAETELKDINNQILAEQRALDNRIKEIEKNRNGLFGGALAQEIQKAKDESLTRQADLSIIQMAKQGRYDSAKQIADRAVAALTEARQNKIQALQFMYSENKDLFNKAEQRSFEIRQKQREDDLAFERNKLMAQFEQQIRQNDPLYKAQLETERAQAAKIRADMAGSGGEPQLVRAQAQSTIGQISSLLANPDLQKAVGPNVFARLSPLEAFTGARGNAIAEVEQITSQLTLDKLIDAKKQGATFGSLTEGERLEIAGAATKIKNWAIKDSTGKVKGYKATQTDFSKELDKINNFAKLDYVVRGGAPADVGVVQTADGHYWSKNSDGTMTRLK